MRLAVLSAADSWYFADLRRAARDRHDARCPRRFRSLGIVGRSVADRRLASTFVKLALTTTPPVRRDPRSHHAPRLARASRLSHGRARQPRSRRDARDQSTACDRVCRRQVPHDRPAGRRGLAVPRTIACQTVEDAMASVRVARPRCRRQAALWLRRPRHHPPCKTRLSPSECSAPRAIGQRRCIFRSSCRTTVLTCDCWSSGKQVLAMRRVQPTRLAHQRQSRCRSPRRSNRATSGSSWHAERPKSIGGSVIAGVDLLPAATGKPTSSKSTPCPAGVHSADAHRP